MKCPICDEETGMEIGGKPFCVFCISQYVQSRKYALDHINGDVHDNRPENLRVVTLKQNT